VIVQGIAPFFLRKSSATDPFLHAEVDFDAIDPCRAGKEWKPRSEFA